MLTRCDNRYNIWMTVQKFCNHYDKVLIVLSFVLNWEFYGIKSQVKICTTALSSIRVPPSIGKSDVETLDMWASKWKENKTGWQRSYVTP